MLLVKVINKGNQPLPTYATELSAGMDLRADIKEALTLHTLDRVLVPTGLYIELPAGYEAQIRTRSGLAIKHGIVSLNSPGTIDADYRGEIGVELINLSRDPYTIYPGERIAQMVVMPYVNVSLELAEDLSDTDRGEGGFGSTGKN